MIHFEFMNHDGSVLYYESEPEGWYLRGTAFREVFDRIEDLEELFGAEVVYDSITNGSHIFLPREDYGWNKE